MADNSGISFEINAKIDKALKQLEQLEASIDKVGKEADKAGDEIEDAFSDADKHIDKADKSASGLSSTFQKLGTVASGVFTAQQFAQYAKAIIDVRANIESLQVSFQTLLGDEQKAADLFGQIKDYAVSTPMQMGDLAEGAKTMLGFGIETEKVMGYLKQLGDISMGDSQKFQSLTLAFSQATSAGKLQGQDLLQLINAGFNPLNEIAKKTGKSIGELKDDMSKGAISAQDLADALASATGEGGMFHNALLDQSQTINGALSNLKGAWDDMLNDMGEGSQDVFVGIVSNITEALKHYRSYLSVIASLASAYGTYKAALMAYTVAQNAATIAQNAFNVAAKANPYVLIISAVVGLGTALYTLTDAFTDNKEELEKQNKELEEAAEKEKEYGEKAKENVKIATSAYVTTKQRKESLEKLKKAYPSIFEKYNEESIMLANIRDLLKEINEEEAKRARQPYQTGVTDSKAKYLEALKNYNKIKGEADKDRVKKGKFDYTDKQKEAIQAAKKDLNDAYDAWFSAENELRKYDNAEKAAKSEINKQKKSANSEVFEAKLKAYNAAKAKFDDVVKDAREGTQKYTVEQAEAIKEDYENAKKEYEDTIGYQPESATNKSNNAATKAAREAAKAFEEKEKAKKEYANALVELEKDASQAEVDAQKEGAEKSLAQIKLDYENRKNEIAKRQKELIEQKKTAGQGDSLNQQEAGYFSSLTKANEAAYAQSLQSLKSVNEQAHREYLEQYGTYEEKRLAIAEKYDAEITAAEGNEWKKRTLEMQKQIALQQASFNEFKSNPKFALAFDSPDNASIETLKTLIEEFTRRANEGQLQGLNLEELKVWFDAANQMYDNLAERDPFTALKESSKQLADAQNRLTTAQNKLNKAKADATKNIKLQVDANGKLVKVEQDLSKLEAEVARAENDVQNAQQKQQKATKAATEYVNQYAAAFRDLGQIIGGTEGKALECIAQTMEFTTSTIDNIQKIANTVASQISATMKALETGLVILAIISAAMKLIQAISELVKSEHELYEEYAKKQTAINDLITSVNDYKIAVAEAAKAEKTWFASSNGSNLREQWKVSENALEAYNKKYNETQAKYVNESGGGWLTKGWGAITSAVNWINSSASKLLGLGDVLGDFQAITFDPMTNGINDILDSSVEKAEDFSGTMVKAFQNLRIETQAATKGFWGTGIGAKSQKTEDLTTWVKENYGEDLFRKDGMINSTLVTQIIEEQGDKLVGETKKTLEKLQEYTDKYDEFKEQLKESVSQLYSPLADDLTDALWEWYKEGTDVMDKFHEYAADTFESIAKDAIKSAVLTKLFDGYKDKIADLYEQYSYSNIDETQLMNAVAAETTALTGQVEAALPTLQAMTKSVGDAIAAAGYASDSSSQISASQRSVASMSEDTASELNGRFTALQISGNSIDTNLKLLALELKNDAKETHGYLKKIVSEAEDISDSSQAEQNIKVNVDAPVVNVNVEPNVNVDAPQVNVNVEPVVNIDAPQVNVTADNSEINSIIQSVNSALMSLTASNGTNVAILNSINGTMESAVSAIMSVQMSIGDSNGMLANINASVLACNGTLNAIYNTNDSGFRTLQQEIRAVASAINNKL